MIWCVCFFYPLSRPTVVHRSHCACLFAWAWEFQSSFWLFDPDTPHPRKKKKKDKNAGKQLTYICGSINTRFLQCGWLWSIINNEEIPFSPSASFPLEQLPWEQRADDSPVEWATLFVNIAAWQVLSSCVPLSLFVLQMYADKSSVCFIKALEW